MVCFSVFGSAPDHSENGVDDGIVVFSPDNCERTSAPVRNGVDDEIIENAGMGCQDQRRRLRFSAVNAPSPNHKTERHAI